MSFNPLPERCEAWTIIIPFCKWDNQGPEKLSNLLKFTQLGSGRVEIQTQIVLAPKLLLYTAS